MLDLRALSFAVRYVSGLFPLCNPAASFGERTPKHKCHTTATRNLEFFLRLVYFIIDFVLGRTSRPLSSMLDIATAKNSQWPCNTFPRARNRWSELGKRLIDVYTATRCPADWYGGVAGRIRIQIGTWNCILSHGTWECFHVEDVMKNVVQ